MKKDVEALGVGSNWKGRAFHLTDREGEGEWEGRWYYGEREGSGEW